MYGSSHKSANNNTRPSPDVYTQKVADHYKLKHYNFSDPAFEIDYYKFNSYQLQSGGHDWTRQDRNETSTNP